MCKCARRETQQRACRTVLKVLPSSIDPCGQRAGGAPSTELQSVPIGDNRQVEYKLEKRCTASKRITRSVANPTGIDRPEGRLSLHSVGHIMQTPGPGHIRISSPIPLRTHFSQAVRSAMVFMAANGHASASGGAAGAAARGEGGGGTVDGGTGEARHSLHRAWRFLCSQMPLPPHSIQM